MADTGTMGLNDIAARLDQMLSASDTVLAAAPVPLAEELLQLGERTLEIWLAAHGEIPTDRKVEDFRLLALHRQGARGDASFNACRESCRELVYHHNLVRLEPGHADVARRLRLGAMVARHLVLFIGGKLEVAALGEFCCASRPLRQRDTSLQANETV
ncbi:MAG TPA: hypothetical protein VMM15_31565 [Bradyrhizobium sp.]|nr:hypothetical protein [Bradyrhizobium sp.]